MAEIDINIQGDSINKVRIDPTEIRAEGSSDYPRLVMPLTLDLHPLRIFIGQNKPPILKPCVISGIKCSLMVQDSPYKIADSLPKSYNIKVFTKYTSSASLEFHLDHYRIKKIEEMRKGSDLKVRLDFYFEVGTYEQLTLQQGQNEEKKILMGETYTAFSQMLNLIIPQSDWIKKILPALNYAEYIIVEIPKSDNKIFTEAWTYLEKAELSFFRWDSQGVFSNCREVGCILDKALKEKIGTGNSSYDQRWGRFYKGFNHWASMDLHRADIKVEAKKADSEHLILVTKSLIKFAEELIKEHT